MLFLYVLIKLLVFPNINPGDPPLLQPVRKSNFKYISSDFGPRVDPFTKKRSFHYGRDIVTDPPNAVVYATGNGIVKTVGREKKLGLFILIQHDSFGDKNSNDAVPSVNFKTKYAHLSEVFVKPNQKVKAGQAIGRIGQSGKATAPHLHYEVWRDGKAVHPAGFIKK